MRNSRDRWTFFKHPSKKPLDTSEVTYWKNTLAKILKVGVEFEFNLPEKKNGSCKGDSNTCPCQSMVEGQKCWDQCLNYKICAETPNIGTCKAKADKCKPEMCKDCETFLFECHGMFCSCFNSACFECNKFNINCDNCSYKYDPNKSPDAIRQKITKELSPTKSYGLVNHSGVHSITTDGSLLGQKGLEVITVGRRVDYWEFYKMAKKIIDSAVEKGAYLNERCSIHQHVLASYYGKIPKQEIKVPDGIPTNIKELEKDMPEIILANFHQLCRRYQNAMTWMTMALDTPESMTRWEKFRVSNLEISAVINSMVTVKEKVSRNAGGNKYGWANYNYTDFNKDGFIRRLHVELRVSDGVISPSAVAAMACLYYALMIKAVEISRYGVLEVGDDNWMSRAIEIKNAMLNGVGGYDGGRFGNTKHLHKYFEDLRGEAFDLVRQLKHALMAIGPAYSVLEKLAERPIALRRCDGETWETIEEDLAVIMNEEGILEAALNEYIDLRLVDECKTMDEWIEVVSKALRNDTDLELNKEEEEIREMVAAYVSGRKEDGELIWSNTLGTAVYL